MRDLAKAGKIQLLGIMQEQHPDRCRLFAQWQQFDWPIVHDPINVIATRAVPVVLAIDEHGVVQSTRPRPDWVRNEFLKTDYPKPDETKSEDPETGQLTASEMQALPNTLKAARSATVWGCNEYRLARKTGGKTRDAAKYFNKAIAAYDAVLRNEPKNAVAHFGRGVALRMRYESPLRQSSDFQAAVDAWGMALEIDPNHYIYRRRIEQYGPRLMKPYPFYDWVAQARKDIKARGEEPVKLAVEPRGAELAKRDRSFDTDLTAKNPDAQGRINRDANGLIEVRSVTVPAKTKPGTTTRLHLQFEPTKDAHWNNESTAPQVWIEAPTGWEIQRNLFELPQTNKPESTEVRSMEFETRLPRNAKDGIVKGFVLYHVCEEQDGTCMYLRKDFEVTVRVTK